MCRRGTGGSWRAEFSNLRRADNTNIVASALKRGDIFKITFSIGEYEFVREPCNALLPVIEEGSYLRDFTPLTETLLAADLLAMLNAYFEVVASAVTPHGGEILRFIGDAMLIVFPVGADGSVDTACRSALDAALGAFAGVATLNHRWRRCGEPGPMWLRAFELYKRFKAGQGLKDAAL